MPTRKLQVEILGDASSLQRALGKSSSASNKFGGSLKTLGKVAAVGIGAAFAGVAVVVKRGMDEIAESQKVMSDTAAIIKSTGGAANVTAKDVANLAEAQSQLTGVDDELIQSSENLLLTFKNVRNEVGKGNDIFNRATAAGLDLAQVGFGTPETAAKMLGKALNDPVRGMTALSRAGVTFSESQKEAIKDLVETGDVLGAQKLILREVESQVGGTAKAYGETFPGQVNKLRNAFDEMSGRIAERLLPIFEQLVSWTVEHMPQIEATVVGIVEGISAAINFLAPIIGTIITAFQRLAEFSRRHWAEVEAAAARALAWYRGTLAPAINTVLTAIRVFWDRFGADIVRIIQLSLGQVLTIVKAVLGNIASVINIILAILRGDWGKAWDEFKEIPRRSLNAVVSLLRGLVGIFSTVARALGAAIIDGITAGLSALVGKVTSELGKIGAAIRNVAGQAAGWAAEIGRAIVSGIVNGMGNLFSAVKDKIVGGVQGAIDGAMGIFGNSPQEVIGISLVDGIVRGWNDRMARGGLKDAMVTKVNDAIDAAQQAITDKQGAFGQAFDALVSNALSAFDRLTSEFETKTERLIRKQDEARANAERQGALQEAQTGLAEAQAGGDPEAIKAAEQQLADAKFAIQRAADERRAAQERQQYEASRERQRVNLEEQLGKLQQSYLNQEITTRQFHTRLLEIFKKFEVPLGKAGAKVGAALAQGLNDSFADVERAAQALAKAVVDNLKRIRIVIAVGVVGSDKPGPAEGRQHGGPVRRGAPYIVGEVGPELFVPNQSGRIIPNSATGGAIGGGTIQLIFNGPTVGTSREFEDAVRRALYDVSRRNPGTGIVTA